MSELKAVKNRTIVSLDIEGKNSHRFTNGMIIRLERNYNNLNKRETQPINAFVVDSEIIPIGSEVLIHHNSFHPVNQIFNYVPLGGNETSSSVKYFSILDEECFLYREKKGSTWNPCNGFATALRIYKPYNGMLQGIEPKLVPNVLWITSGKLKNNACHTVTHADYELVFQGINGQEERVIRVRYYNEDEPHEREDEIIAIDHSLTKKIKSGECLIGLTPSKAEKLNQVYAN